jgi:hypothetical protein
LFVVIPDDAMIPADPQMAATAKIAETAIDRLSGRSDGGGVHRQQQGAQNFTGDRASSQGCLDIQARLRDTSTGLGQRGSNEEKRPKARG